MSCRLCHSLVTHGSRSTATSLPRKYTSPVDPSLHTFSTFWAVDVGERLTISSKPGPTGLLLHSTFYANLWRLRSNSPRHHRLGVPSLPLAAANVSSTLSVPQSLRGEHQWRPRPRSRWHRHHWRHRRQNPPLAPVCVYPDVGKRKTNVGISQ